MLEDIFSLASSRDETVESVVAKQFDYFMPLAPQIAQMQAAYAARKKAANAMDFDDLLIPVAQVAAGTRGSSRSEFSGGSNSSLWTSIRIPTESRANLIDLLAARHHNVMVVGDDSQSIYSWRGAHFQNIIKFPDRYEKSSVFRIEINYRSTPEILKLANAAIAANTNQFAKN